MKVQIQEIRNKTKDVFELYLKNETNINKLEKIIHKHIAKTKPYSVDKYKTFVYEIGLLLQKKTKFSLIVEMIEAAEFGWGNENFKQISYLIEEQNNFIKNPFEVEEGIFQCKAFVPETGKICGSKRVYSYAKQDRSSDEGTSVYATCMRCGCKWRERG